MRAKFFYLILSLILLIMAFTVCVYILLLPKANSATSTVFEIKTGESTKQVADKLQEKGIIKSAFAFRILKQINGNSIVPGVYVLDSSKSAPEILEVFAKGKSSVAKITLLEGWRAKDMEEYLVTQKGLSQFLGFTSKAEKYEGYLYPDTYEILITANINDLITLLRETFTKKTEQLKPTKDQIILASIIEREAANDSERAGISGVYSNRIEIGMRLEADPTIQYAKGNWDAVKLSEYRSVISPYNTYLNDGLPPTPIANPGIKSIEAALNPQQHSYYFFFHAKGNIYYSRTLQEHRAKLKDV